MVFTNVERRSGAVVQGHRLAVFFLAAGLLLLPLGMGGNRALPLALCQISMAVSFLLMIFTAHELLSRPWPRRLRWALYLYLIVLLWSLLQAAGFTPVSWHHPLWRPVSEALQMPYHGSLSLSPQSTMTAINRLATYGLMLVAVFYIARNNQYSHALIRWFWFTGISVCAYAIIAHILDFSPFLWIEKKSYHLDVTGTFVNRNHFADYAGLTLMAGIALAWNDFLHRKSYARSENSYFSFSSWFVGRGLFYSFGIIVAFLALVTTHSRAGMISSFVGMAIFTGSYLIYKKNYKMAAIVPFLCVLASLCVVVVFFQYGRFSVLFTDGSAEGRFENYARILDLMGAKLLTGYGLGSFEKTYMLYYDDTFNLLFQHAHSDWLELIFDLGLIAGLMLLISIALVISGCWHGIRTRRRQGIYPALGLGASALMLSHALFDFNTQIPGLVASWLIFLGAGIAQGWSQENSYRPVVK